MSEQAKLLPCPFCGETITTFTTTQGTKWGAVECSACGCIGPEVRTHYKATDWHYAAIEEWNRRAKQ